MCPPGTGIENMLMLKTMFRDINKAVMVSHFKDFL